MATQNKCLIQHCSCIRCPKCWYWYDPLKPKSLAKHKKECAERPKPNRQLEPTCVPCRNGFSYNGHKTWAERDERDRHYLKLHDRFVYLKEHPKRPAKRKQSQVRTTRSTNAARTTTQA